MSKIGLDVWIQLTGWAGLLGSILLAVSALFAPARGVDAAGALGYLPHALASLLTIGAGRALEYLGGIADDTKRLRRSVEDALQSQK